MRPAPLPDPLTQLPPEVTYIAGEDVPDAWNCYPWDARAYGRDINAHEVLARGCAGEEAPGARGGSLALVAAALAGAAAALAASAALAALRGARR